MLVVRLIDIFDSLVGAPISIVQLLDVMASNNLVVFGGNEQGWDPKKAVGCEVVLYFKLVETQTCGISERRVHEIKERVEEESWKSGSFGCSLLD